MQNWRMQAGFLMSVANSGLQTQLIQVFFAENSASATPADICWEAFNVTIWGWIIHQEASLIKKERAKTEEYTKNICALEVPLPVMLANEADVTGMSRQLATLRSELSAVLQSSINQQRFHANRLHFFEAERSPQLLAWKLRGEASQNIFPAIITQSGARTTDPTMINMAFYYYYSDLYKAISPASQNVARTLDFILAVKLP